MKTVFLFVLIFYSFNSINATLYQTINDGQFFDSSIWDRNEVPKFLKGDSIIIKNHVIAIDSKDTFGAKNNVFMEVSNTGILCLEKDYVVYVFKIIVNGKIYFKKADIEYCYIDVYGFLYFSKKLSIQFNGGIRFNPNSYGKGSIDIVCPEIPSDTDTYSVKCPKLSFAYRDSLINDSTSIITFWNSQNTIMKVKIKDSIYSILSGNFIKIKHKPIEDVIVSIQAVDNCDRLKEHAFKLIYDGKIQTSSLTEIKENSDFLVYSISNNIWKISAGKPDLYTYRIYDLSGKNIVEGKFKQNTEINLENQAQGIYFIQIENNQSIVFSQKIALED